MPLRLAEPSLLSACCIFNFKLLPRAQQRRVTNSVQPSSGTSVQTVWIWKRIKVHISFKIRRTTRDADMNLEPFLSRPGQIIRSRNESNMPMKNHTKMNYKFQRITKNENEKKLT